MYVVGEIENDTNQTIVDLRWIYDFGPFNYEDLLGVDDPYAGNSDFDGLAYISLDDLRFELARFDIPYRPGDIRYIEPLRLPLNPKHWYRSPG